MKWKALSTVIICIVCIPLFTSCSLLPLREQEANSQKVEEEEKEDETEADTKDLIIPSEVEEEKDIMVCTSPVNVRDGASSQSRVIGSLKKGEEVTALSDQGGWIEIIYEGDSAYVYEDYLEEAEDSISIYGEDLDEYDSEDTLDQDSDEMDGTDSTDDETETKKPQMYLDE